MANIEAFMEDTGLTQAQLTARAKAAGKKSIEAQISKAVREGLLKYAGKGRPGPNRKLVRA